MEIHSAKVAIGHPDRALECQFQLDPACQELLRRARAAGWTANEVAVALVDLGINNFKTTIAEKRAQQDLVIANRPKLVWTRPVSTNLE
jgi:hypothetical protein